MTVSRLRQELTQAEFLYWAAYYEIKAEREKEQLDMPMDHFDKRALKRYYEKMKENEKNNTYKST